tara:strand:+ start:29611 stop:30798 length:1188 start_codon:yes stop_codon:yes gene_type:complete
MARLPFIAALQAAVGPTELGMVGPDTPARPEGTVIWAHCAHPDQLPALKTLGRRLIEDGEMITIIPTLPEPDQNGHQVSPNTRHSTRAFLDYWRPKIVLWQGGQISAAPLLEIKRTNIPVIFLQTQRDRLEPSKPPRFSGKLRTALGVFAAILAIDDASAQRLVKLGADPAKTRVLGPLEDGVSPPPYNEPERAKLVTSFAARPMWLAADVPMAELSLIAQAHRHVERRAHRTLLVLTPRIVADGMAMADLLRSDGFTVACRSAGEIPKEATQIYIADTGDGLGLWCRLAPMTYLGGSFSDGEIPDLFAPATVGSAVLVGQRVAQFTDHIDRLVSAQALHSVAAPEVLGRAVETLLATDYAAQLAHAAWDVTSRGADATNDLVTLIYTFIDRLDP